MLVRRRLAVLAAAAAILVQVLSVAPALAQGGNADVTGIPGQAARVAHRELRDIGRASGPADAATATRRGPYGPTASRLAADDAVGHRYVATNDPKKPTPAANPSSGANDAPAAVPSAPYTAFVAEGGAAFIDGVTETLVLSGYPWTAIQSYGGTYLYLTFHGPDDAPLVAGSTYSNVVVGANAVAGRASMYVEYNRGRTSDGHTTYLNTTGTFTVLEYTTVSATDHTVTTLAVDYAVDVPGGGTATGQVRYNSTFGYRALVGSATTGSRFEYSSGSYLVGVGVGSAKTVTMRNVGTDTLTLGAASTIGPAAGDLAITSNDCPATLSPGAICTLGLTLTASTAGQVKAAASLAVTEIGDGRTAFWTYSDATWVFTVTVSGTGTGSVAWIGAPYGAGFSCDTAAGTCQGLLFTDVLLAATSAAGSTFAGWQGDCSGIGQCTIPSDANHSVTAVFNSPTALALPAGIQASNGLPGFGDYYPGCTYRPCFPEPNPSVAVSPTQIIHAVFGSFEVRDRQTGALVWADIAGFFHDPALANNGGYANPLRVVWDGAHQRWYMSAGGGQADVVYLAVSDTADAMGGWVIYQLHSSDGKAVFFTNLGASTNKIVVAYELACMGLYCSTAGDGTKGVVVNIADLVALPSVLPLTTINLPDLGMVVVQNAGSSNAYLVSTNYVLVNNSFQQRVANLTVIRGSNGVGAGPTATTLPIAGVAPYEDIAWPNYGNAQPFTQAIWAGGSIWTVESSACSFNKPYACLRADKFDVTDSTAPRGVDRIEIPSEQQDLRIGNFAEGVAADGTLLLSWSQQRPDAGTTTYVTSHLTTDPAGTHRTPVPIDNVAGSTADSQYFQYAQDPSDTHAVWGAFALPTTSGGWNSWVSRLSAGNTGTLTGATTINDGKPSTYFLRVRLGFAPASTAPATLVRVSDSATMSSYYEMSIPDRLWWQLDDLSYGGSKAAGSRHVYVQWGDGLGNWSAVTQGTTTIDASVPVSRLSGADRYATAAAISKAGFDPGVGRVFIATGLNYPDALAGAAVAARDGSPMLFVDSSIPAATAAELTRLQPKSIVILGGTAVVPSSVETALHAYTTGPVSRLSGSDRFGTAAAISSTYFAPGVSDVFIAFGYNFPDALAAAPIAGLWGDPILFVSATTLPDSIAQELARLHPTNIIILGSSVVISDGVVQALQAYAPYVFRVYGQDRYETAVALSSIFNSGLDQVFFASGLNFPDALAGAALAGWYGGPILYTNRTSSLPAATADELWRLVPKQAFLFGGTAVIPDGVKSAIASRLGP